MVDDFEGARPTSALPLSRRLLAVGCSDGAVRLWDVSKTQRVRTLRGGSGDVVPVTHLANARPANSEEGSSHHFAGQGSGCFSGTSGSRSMQLRLRLRCCSSS